MTWWIPLKALPLAFWLPKMKKLFIGYAKIKQVFKVSDAGKIAGCLITEGIEKRSWSKAFERKHRHSSR